jgi:hypothetical protein
MTQQELDHEQSTRRPGRVFCALIIEYVDIANLMRACHPITASRSGYRPLSVAIIVSGREEGSKDRFPQAGNLAERVSTSGSHGRGNS